MWILFRVLINLSNMSSSHSLKELTARGRIELGICNLENEKKSIIRCTLESIPVKYGMVQAGEES
jgi:hypothetical protein